MKLQNLIVKYLIIFFSSLTLLPLIPTFSYDYHNHQRIIQVATLLCISLLLIINLNTSKNYPKIQNDHIFKYLLAFISLGGITSLFGNEVKFSLMYTFHTLLLVMATYYVTKLSDKKSILTLIYGLIVAHTALVLICTLNIVFTLYEQQPLNRYVIYSGFINIRFFNQVQVFILPFLILLLKFKSIQRIVFIILFLNLLLMFIGQARGAILSFLVICILALALKTTLKKQIITSLISLMLAFLAFYFLDSLNKGSTEILRTSSSGRLDLWLTTLSNLSLKNIFIGNGPGIFGMSLGSSAPFSHPHNSIIEVLNEWGGLALLCLLIAVAKTVKKSIYHLKYAKKDIITEAIFYSFVIGMAYSLFSGVHVMPVSQTLLFLMWGLLLGRIYITQSVSCKIGNWIKLVIAILFMLACYLYVNKILSIYDNIDPEKGYTIGPRFWSVGQRH